MALKDYKNWVKVISSKSLTIFNDKNKLTYYGSGQYQ